MSVAGRHGSLLALILLICVASRLALAQATSPAATAAPTTAPADATPAPARKR